MPHESGGHNPPADAQHESHTQLPVPPSTPEQREMREQPNRSAGNTFDHTAKLERDIKIGEICLIVINALLLITTIAIAKIYYGQLQEMRKATEAATKSANTADATLKEIQRGSSDTHELAVQAKNQADRTKDVVGATKAQSDALKDSIKANREIAQWAYGPNLFPPDIVLLPVDSREVIVKLAIYNYGHATAYHMQAAVMVGLRETIPRREDYTNDFRNADAPFLLILNPANRDEHSTVTFDRYEIPTTTKGKRLFVWGTIKFQGGMEVWTMQRFCGWTADVEGVINAPRYGNFPGYPHTSITYCETPKD